MSDSRKTLLESIVYSINQIEVKAALQLGGSGYIQHVFKNKADADSFVNEVHQFKDLKDINKAKAIEFLVDGKPDGKYMVKLSQAQFDVISNKLMLQNKKEEKKPTLTTVMKSSSQLKPSEQDKKSADELFRKIYKIDCSNVQKSGEELSNILLSVSPSVLSILIPLQIYKQWTVLQVAAQHQGEAAFQALVCKCSAEALNTALVKQGKDQWTALHVAAREQSEAGFQALVGKCTANALGDALVKQANDQWTALHVVARYQGEAAFQALVCKCSAEALNTALVKQADSQWTALHTAARYQGEAAFQALVCKCSAEALNTALVKQEKDQWTALHMAARFQGEVGVKGIVEKCSMGALSQASQQLTNNNESILHPLLRYHSAKIGASFLLKLNDKAIEFLIDDAKKNPVILNLLLSNVLFESIWQDKNLLAKLLPHLTSELFNFAKKTYLAGKVVSPGLLDKLIEYVDKNNNTKLFDKVDSHILSAWKSQRDKDEKNNDKEKESKKLNAKEIWESGLKSIVDYHDLKRDHPNTALSCIADALFSAGLLFTGSKESFDETLFPILSEDIKTILESGDAAFKIVKNEHHNDFVKQLSNYSYRATLRDSKKKLTEIKEDKEEIINIKNIKKYLHREAKSVDYKIPPQEKKKDYFSTKKQSATLMSTDKNTAVFGENDAKRQLVGVLADMTSYCEIARNNDKFEEKAGWYTLHVEQSKVTYYDDDKKEHSIPIETIPGLTKAIEDKKDDNTLKQILEHYVNKKMIKAMFTEDRGTFARDWIGDETSVKKYADTMKKISYTEYEKFKEVVKKYPNRLNEILVKFTRTKLKAIFIASDTLEARKIARERQEVYRKELKIDIPIVIYDRAMRTCKLYTPIEKHNDELGYNIVKKNHYDAIYHFSEMLQIMNQARKSYTSFFGLIPEGVEGIIRIISNVRYGQLEASEGYDQIKAILETKEKGNNFFRNQATQDVYNDLNKIIEGINKKSVVSNKELKKG